jgi:hypothetical protein
VEAPIVEEKHKEQLSTEEIGDWESAFQEDEPLTFGTDKKISDTYVHHTPVEKPKVEVEQEKVESTSTNSSVSQVEVQSVAQKNTEVTVEEKPVVIEEKQTEVIQSKPEIIVSKPEVISPKSESVESKPEMSSQKEQQIINPSVQENNTFPQQEQLTKEETNTSPSSKQTEISQTTYSAFDNPWGEDDDGFSEPVPHTSLFFQSDDNKQEEQNHTLEPNQESKPIPEPVMEKPIQKPEPVQHQQTIPLESITEKKEEQEPTQQQQFDPSIPEDVQYGLRVLETATNEGQGMANGWEVCRALADLRRIWVIVDMEGKMVILASQNENQVADFFTSQEYAQTLIDEAHGRNKSLPPMVPRLISTKKLFRALAPTSCVIWINRGSPNAWTSIMGDTLPYVLQLMAQK